MIYSGLLVITNVIVDNTEVDMSQEFTGNISDFLMLVMELDSLLVEIWLISLSKFHIINTDAVIGKSLTMNITDCFTHLEELFILLNSLLVLSEVVIKDSG